MEVWDKKTPINGVPAEEILAKRTDIPQGGEVYLVKRDGRVWIFQPHEPGTLGFVKMIKTKARQAGDKHSDEIAGDRMRQRVLEAATSEL